LRPCRRSSRLFPYTTLFRSLCPQKGQDVLVRAWESVRGRVPGARLVLVGDGPDRDRLRALAPELVLFAGAVADPVPWYRAADLRSEEHTSELQSRENLVCRL